ncbi:MAG6450 family protein [Salinicoccus roseus]|uniref:MAG6450 family protein n=1 Tax=Salinicoccus roseus TaxID=45670 RepID=UPI003D9FBF9E
MKLTDISAKKDTASGVRLVSLKERKFKLAFGTALDNKFCFKTKKSKQVTDGLHKFLEETVYKNLTITQVDNKYLRTKGPIKEKVSVQDGQLEIMHYGFGKSPFRLFGYYDNNGYFNITKIDPNHKTHK